MFKTLLISTLPLLVHSECHYVKPVRTMHTVDFFREIVAQSNHPDETFQTILTFFNDGKESFHTFHFEYPVGDEAESFFKVMEIKAQEAHRFVPVFADCQFLYPVHLGFLRKAVIENGPTIWEHVLVDKKSKAIIFLEEEEVLPNGEKIEGCFAALNTLIDNDGQWFFSGTYLYTEQPTSEEIEQREEMFWHTYKNMIALIQSGESDSIHAQLQEY